METNFFSDESIETGFYQNHTAVYRKKNIGHDKKFSVKSVIWWWKKGWGCNKLFWEIKPCGF